MIIRTRNGVASATVEDATIAATTTDSCHR